MNIISDSAAAHLAKPDKAVYFAGCTAEPVAIINAVRQDPELWNNVQLYGTFIPGVNRFDYASLGSSTTVNCLFPTAAMRGGNNARLMQIHPLSYYKWARVLEHKSNIDLVYCQVSPPNDQARVSLGFTADFIPSLLNTKCKLVGIINPHVPFVPGSPSIALDRFEAFVESEEPLPEFTPGDSDTTMNNIAAHVKTLLRDGDILQLGLGKLQQVLLPLLSDMQQLGLHGGMISDPVLDLFEGGVFVQGVTTGVALGSEKFYSDATSANFADFRYQPVSMTHSPSVLSSIDNFVAINSVLEVDLLGQVNVAYAGASQVTAPGGLTDFVKGATSSRGGRSILALPSTSRDGQSSRIVKRLARNQPVSIPRQHVHYIVTEYGIADLQSDLQGENGGGSGSRAGQVAEKLAAIAHPKFRDSLVDT